jgi:hypothetical protein
MNYCRYCRHWDKNGGWVKDLSKRCFNEHHRIVGDIFVTGAFYTCEFYEEWYPT